MSQPPPTHYRGGGIGKSERKQATNPESLLSNGKPFLQTVAHFIYFSHTIFVKGVWLDFFAVVDLVTKSLSTPPEAMITKLSSSVDEVKNAKDQLIMKSP